LFSPATIERLEEFYQRTTALPYKREMRVPDTQRLQLEYTGWMIPPALTRNLPDWLKTPLLGQLLWKWIAALILLLLVLWSVMRVWRRTSPPAPHTLSVYLRRLAAPVAALILLPVLNFILRHQILIIGVFDEVMQLVIPALMYLAAAWSAWLLALAIAE
jgi:hypothetical protein